MASLGLRLRQLRAQKGLSQRQLAAKTGCAVETISRLENDHHVASGLLLHQLALALDAEDVDLDSARLTLESQPAKPEVSLLGHRITQFRMENRLTRTAFARQYALTYDLVNRLEKGLLKYLSQSNFATLARALRAHESDGPRLLDTGTAQPLQVVPDPLRPSSDASTPQKMVSPLGHKVRELRLRTGLSMLRLARSGRISVSFIHDLETGSSKHVSSEKVERLAAALGVPSQELWDVLPQQARGKSWIPLGPFSGGSKLSPSPRRIREEQFAKRRPQVSALGQRIRQHRLDMFATRKEFAAGSGLSLDFIRRLEDGFVGSIAERNVECLARAMHLEEQELLALLSKPAVPHARTSSSTPLPSPMREPYIESPCHEGEEVVGAARPRLNRRAATEDVLTMEQVEKQVPLRTLARALAEVPDARRSDRVRYNMGTTLALAVCAMLCGARSVYAIARWGREHSAQLRKALGLRHRTTPCSYTLWLLFHRLDRDKLEVVLGEYLERQGLGPPQAIALDGKRGRGQHGEQVPGVHLAAAYARELGRHLAGKRLHSNKGS